MSDTVSVINGKTHNIMAGLSFDVKPFHSGRIICEGLTVPTNQYFYVDSGTQCTAESNQGFSIC